MADALLQRAHLEALLVALVLHRPRLAGRVQAERLSPAAIALVRFCVDRHDVARISLYSGVADEYQYRLARRTLELTLEEQLFFPASTLIGLVNALPAISATRRTRHAA